MSNPIIPTNGKFTIEYQNEESNSKNTETISLSELLYFKLNINTRELRRLEKEEDGDLKSHGVGLYVAWTLLSYMMLITGRYMKIFYWWRMILHTLLGFVILILTIIFVSMGEGEAKSSNTADIYII